MFFNCNGDFALVWTWKGTKESDTRLCIDFHLNASVKMEEYFYFINKLSYSASWLLICFKSTVNRLEWKEETIKYSRIASADV